MKKMYLALLLLPAVSNVNIVFSMTDDDNDMNMSNIDSCPSFTMESEKELKELLRKNGFFYYEESGKLAKKLANRTMTPFEVVNEVILTADDIHFRYIITENEDEKLRYNRHKANLITALLTNHPEAIECIEANGNLRNIDPCRSFIMESEEELKRLLKNNGFSYFDKKIKISKDMANEESSPYRVYNGVMNRIRDLSDEELTKLLRNDRFEYVMPNNAGDMENDMRVRLLNNGRIKHLIRILLTNHPEAIKCLEAEKTLETGHNREDYPILPDSMPL